MTDILDFVIPHQVRLERVKSGMQKDVLRLLKQMEKEIYGEIMASNLYAPKRPTFRERRMKALLVAVNKSINSFTGKANRFTKKEMVKLRAIQATFVQKAIADSLHIKVPTPVLTPAMLETAAATVVVNGAPSSEWWKRQNKSMTNKFQDRIRQGFIQGKPTAKIVQSIRGTRAAGFRDGIMKGTAQQVAGLVRTNVQTMANTVNLAEYKRNPLVEGIEWAATFDDRTTEICAALDGMQWDKDLNPIGGASPFPGSVAHWACRSLQVPIIVSFEKLATKNKKLAGKLDKQMTPAMKQSMGGPIRSDFKFHDWLKVNPDAADRVLGVKKAQLWRDGKLTTRQLIDESLRPLTIGELI